MDNETVIESRGNVFADLGVADAKSHLLKAGLVHKLAAVIRSAGSPKPLLRSSPE